jgi:hypothetical protein
VSVTGNVPLGWANDQPVSREDRLAIGLLRQAGCTCELPLLRNARDGNGNWNDGPRCKACNSSVILLPPSDEEKLAYKRRSHQVAVNYARQHPGSFGGWVSECFAGCGCEETGEKEEGSS